MRQVNSRILCRSFGSDAFCVVSSDISRKRNVARAHHAAGYVISEATRASESYDAILQYEQIDAASQSRAAGIERFVERIYNIQQYLDEEEEYHLRKQREIRQIGVSLREALGKGNREI